MKTTYDKLQNFINGIGALRKLIYKANKDGSLIEGLVIYASLVDGMCRMSLILHEQIFNKNDSINESYIFQNESDKSYKYNYNERKIYEKMKNYHLIDENLYEEINDLYDIRNKTVHKFLISSFEYSHLEIVLEKYELVFQELYNIVFDLEREQIRNGVGMTKNDDSIINEENINKEILKKIKSDNIDSIKNTLNISEDEDLLCYMDNGIVLDKVEEQKEILKEKQSIPREYDSVKEIVYFAKSKGVLEECICGHPKILHVNLNDINDLDLIKPKSCSSNECGCPSFEKS